MARAIVIFLAVLCWSAVVAEPSNVVETTSAESNDTEVLQQWLQLESKLEDFLHKQSTNILRDILPQIEELDIGTACISSLMKFRRKLNELDVEAMKMLDASGRAVAGFIHGTMSDFGNFDECLSVNMDPDSEKPLVGKYCLAELRLPLPKRPARLPRVGQKPLVGGDGSFRRGSLFEHFSNHSSRLYRMAFRQGLCVPSPCEVEDVRAIYTQFAKSASLIGSVAYCQRQEDFASNGQHWSVHKMAAIIVLALVSAIPFGASLIKLAWVLVTGRAPAWLKPVENFTIDRTLEKIFSPSNPKSSSELKCVHGVRVFSLIWIIVGHSYAYLDLNSLANAMSIQDALLSWFFQPISNAWLIVDTFFCLSGFLLTHHTLRGKRSWFDLPLKLALRYWRLIPLAVLVICMQFIFDDIFDGPLMPVAGQPMTQECRRSWWTLLAGFVRLEDENACLPHLWYVAADLKLFAILLPLSTLLLFSPRIAVILHIVGIVLSSAFAAIVSWRQALPPTVFLGDADLSLAVEVASSVYADARTHFSSYAIGSLAAFALKNYEGGSCFRLRRVTVVCCWAFSIVSAGAALVATRFWAIGTPEIIWSALYAGLQRPIWSLSIGWMLFACCAGHGGVAANLLSRPTLVPLSRLSYAIYLCHAFVVYANVRASHERKEASHYSILRDAAAAVFFSTGLGLLATALLEAPLIAVQKFILSPRQRKERPPSNDLNAAPVQVAVCRF